MPLDLACGFTHTVLGLDLTPDFTRSGAHVGILSTGDGDCQRLN